ncbi:MAG: TIGR02328 family protein, partial [Acidaminococcaceae bacterium]|nr:TIGR02328 family protein [Acidaminococcaceae bacterium]
MRLWHVSLIKYLPRQQLLGQHRECCALRGKGWGKPHATVNYVFQYSPLMLYQFHLLVMQEMEQRGYHADKIWLDSNYRGK